MRTLQERRGVSSGRYLGPAVTTGRYGDRVQREGESTMATTGVEQQPLLIGGEWTGASGGATFERTDPYTGDAVTIAAAASREDARRACDAAAAAFPEWSRTPPGERRMVLTRAADLLMERAPDIAATMTE